MENTQQGSDPSAWFSATLGTAIGVYVDRTLNKGLEIPPSTGYGMDDNGNIYTLGQTSQAPAAARNNNTLLLVMLVAFAVWEMK